MSEFTIKFEDAWKERFERLAAIETHAVGYILEGVDRVFFSFRRDRVLPRAKSAFRTSGGLSRSTNKKTGAHGWRIARSEGKTLKEIIGRVYIASKAAVAHEEGATVRPTKGEYLFLPNYNAPTLRLKSGRISKAKQNRLLDKTRLRSSERVFTRQLSSGSIGVFLESGKTKTGKFRKGAKTELLGVLTRQVEIKPKLGVLKAWTDYGSQIQKRMLEQYTFAFEDWFAGKKHKRGRRGKR